MTVLSTLKRVWYGEQRGGIVQNTGAFLRGDHPDPQILAAESRSATEFVRNHSWDELNRMTFSVDREGNIIISTPEPEKEVLLEL